MYGTLKGALEARRVRFDPATFRADVVGRVEDDGSGLRITDILLRYRFDIAEGQRAAADRALDAHPDGCPARRSVEGAIPVRWEADVREVAEGSAAG